MNKLLSFLTAITLCLTAHSQEKGSFEYGVYIGFNIAQASNPAADDAQARVAPTLGTSGDYFFSDRWSIKAKVIYDPKGWNNGYVQDQDMVMQTSYHYNYLTIPLMANWHFGKKRNWYINVGPYVGFLLSAKEKLGYIDLKAASKSTDAGIAYGIGVKIPVSGKIRFFLEIDEQNGLTDIVNDKTDIFVTSGGFGFPIKNYRTSINGGLLFHL